MIGYIYGNFYTGFKISLRHPGSTDVTSVDITKVSNGRYYVAMLDFNFTEPPEFIGVFESIEELEVHCESEKILDYMTIPVTR